VLKVKSRDYKGKSYYKYRINVPKNILEAAGFKKGDELTAEAKKGEVKLKKSKPSNR